MRASFTVLSLVLAALTLGACDEMNRTAPVTDLTIKVRHDANGNLVAVPPPCPSWHDVSNGPWENTPLPQFGCATAHNLAVMVEDPVDLVAPREMGPAEGTVQAASMHNYVSGKVKALVDPNKKEPTIYNVSTTNPGSGGDK